MGTCFRRNFHVNSLLCHSQTLRDSRCSSLCLAHGLFEDPSDLVSNLIIALIWNLRNSRVKTINIATIEAITMAPRLLRKDRSRVRSRLITTNYEGSRNLHIPRYPQQLVSTLSRFHELKRKMKDVHFKGEKVLEFLGVRKISYNWLNLFQFCCV